MKFKIAQKLVLIAIYLMPAFFVGCGDGGGSPGDANDPVKTSDEEQMQDETGEVE